MQFTPPPNEFGAPHRFSEWRDGQDKLFWDTLDAKTRFAFFNAPVGCHAPGTQILLYTGKMKSVEDVCVGDVLIGPDSLPRRVTQIHSGIAPMYKVTPVRGSHAFDVSGEHVLHLVQTQQAINPSKRRYAKSFESRRKNVQVTDYLTRSNYFKENHKLVRADIIEFKRSTARLRTIPPYFLGLILGDGSCKYNGAVNITTADPEIVNEIYGYAAANKHKVRKTTKKDADGRVNKASTYFLNGEAKGNRWRRNALTEKIRGLGLFRTGSGDKFVPQCYLTGPSKTRMELLAGLLDTDGSLASNCFDYVTKSSMLASGVAFIVRSLGLMCNEAEKIIDGVTYYRLSISGHTDLIPTRIKRKQASKRKQKKNPRVSGFDVNPIGDGEYFGFEVDGDHLYLTADFVIHHNCGKSLAYMTAAIAQGKRVAVLTESKSLQDQLAKDFGAVGLFDMRGLQNYTCRALSEGGAYEKMWSKRWGQPTCEIGPCTGGIRCDLKDQGCDYFDDYKRACGERLITTNYAYWIAIHMHGQGLGNFDTLILDECHKADAQLSSALSVEFTQKDLKELKSNPPSSSANLQAWRMWGRVNLNRCTGKLDFFTRGNKVGAAVGGMATFVVDSDLPDATELKFWKKLEGKCKTLSDSTDDWVVGIDENGVIRISPVWVRKYAENTLFLNIPEVRMYSATVRPKLGDLLGIETDKYEFHEYPSTFPVERRPIYWIPTVRMNKNVDKAGLRAWVARIDEIIAGRLDRKGIIHTVSYPRQKFLYENSKFRDLMYTNESGNTRDVVKSFRDAKAPAILVSPSVGTGFDFPFDLARYQIISKIPFKDPRGAILQAQAKDDPDYLNYLTAQDVIQMYGRPNRDPKDFSETLIVDDSIEWFLDRYSGYHYSKKKGRFNMREPRPNVEGGFFPYYFLEAFQRVDGVPLPPTLEEIAA